MLNFDQIVGKATAGSQLRITFKPEATGADARRLHAMNQAKVLEIKDQGAPVLLAFMRSGSWGGRKKRVFIITPTETFDPNWFKEDLKHSLEKIEAA